MFKKTVVILLALLLAASLVACKKEDPTPTQDPTAGLEDPAPVEFEAGTIEGSALSWELYYDGTLYIKGTGDMPDFEENSGTSTRQPWKDYAANSSDVTIKKVIVEEGVTSLSQGAFQGCINLETVEIADTVTVIPAKCFQRCTVLRSVRGKGVVEISDGAFQHCERLSSLTVSASLHTVWDGAFSDCATKGTSALAVHLAGDAAEWEAAQAKMAESEEDSFAIWTGNEALLTALESVTFYSK